jgi:hypothetical protein
MVVPANIVVYDRHRRHALGYHLEGKSDFARRRRYWGNNRLSETVAEVKTCALRRWRER